MKKLLTAICILYSGVNFAQVNLEHQYTKANVYITQIGATDWNYYTFIPSISTLTIYDINHSLLKTISIPAVSGFSPEYIYSVSTNLFNTDSYYEYGVVYIGPYDRYFIYNELGTQLLNVDSANYSTCYNTSAGLKLIINSAGAKVPFGNVYSLGGNFLAATPEIGNGNNNYTLSNPYPDPSNSMIHLTYDLPAGTDKAEMVITNLNGQVVKTCNVGSAFSNILLDTKQYAPGEYLYYIHTDNYTSPASKFVISR